MRAREDPLRADKDDRKTYRLEGLGAGDPKRLFLNYSKLAKWFGLVSYFWKEALFLPVFILRYSIRASISLEYRAYYHILFCF